MKITLIGPKCMCICLVVVGLLLFISCEKDSGSDTSKIEGVWDDGGTLWVFKPNATFNAYNISESDDYVSVEEEYLNAMYRLDEKNDLLYTTYGGNTTAAQVITLTSSTMSLLDNNVVVNFTKVDSDTEGKSPESVSGKRLAIGGLDQNIVFGSGNSCVIKFDFVTAMMNPQIIQSPVYSYTKTGVATAILSYVYGDVCQLLSWLSAETTRRCTLTLYFTAPNIGYVMGNCVEEGVEHDQDSGDDSFSRTVSWDLKPFIILN